MGERYIQLTVRRRGYAAAAAATTTTTTTNSTCCYCALLADFDLDYTDINVASKRWVLSKRIVLSSAY